MWQEFFRFDLRYQLRQPLLWLMTVPLMALAFLTAGSPTFRLGGGIGNAHLNAPVVIANQLGVLSMLAMFLVAVFIAGAVLRDSEAGIADLLYATPMRKVDYLGGRCLAGLAACLLVFVPVVLAMMLGSLTSGADPARLHPVTPLPYLWSFAVLLVPNLLFVAALLMLLAVAGRSMLLVYVGVLAFFVLWAASGLLAARPALAMAAALLDPFGVRALAQATRYFSSAERNTALPPVAGLLLANRLLWSVLSLALLAAAIRLFKPQRAGTARSWFRRAVRAQPAATPATARIAPPAVLRRIAPRFGAATAWRQFRQLLVFDALGVLKSVPFLVMLLLALANFIANVSVGGLRFDSVPYPLTRLMLVELADSMNTVLALVVLFYSGELVFRDRQVKIAGLTGALPVPPWLPLLAQCGALLGVMAVFLGAGVLAAIAVQLVRGGVRPEPLLYLQGSALNAARFVLLALAMLALQVWVNRKFAAYALCLLLLALKPLLMALGYEQDLYAFAALPPLVYSDLNGYGGQLAGWLWFALYWLCGAVALLVAAQRWRAAVPAARARAMLAASLAGFAATGGWIFYNTHVLNPYQSGARLLDARAEHEQRYRRYLDLPQPGITAISANVDLYPEQRGVAIRGRYRLSNRGAAPLRTVYLQLDTAAQTTLSQLPAHRVLVDDARHGVRIIELAEALAPGASFALEFLVTAHPHGFTAAGNSGGVQHNGSYFTNEQYFPHLGYNASRDITDSAERRQRGLGAPHGMPGLDDARARYSNYWKQWGIDGDLAHFDTTISTSADQVAIAPGTLLRSWQQGARRYFTYRLAQPALPVFSFQSGRWQVARGAWQDGTKDGAKEVAIEVYHDARHAWNTASMMAGARQALAYNTAQFGPYPWRHLRIVEFPVYQEYARSFPGVIPFSESLGFISDLRAPDGVDHVFYVTAHEVAHQWWGDQLIAANVQGSGMLTESLAEYAALMAVEQRYGAGKAQPILRFDLDAYLAGRGKASAPELPLLRSEGQAYIEYRKGSLVFYRLRAEIGEAALNRALRTFLARHRYRPGMPYATSRDLLACIRAETPAAQQQLVTDLFERIVLYDNRLAGASARRRPDGRWDVTLQLQLAKLEVDSKGRETARAYDEPVELAVYADGAHQPLYRGRQQLPAGASTVTVTVDARPGEAVLDPDQLLIERNSTDNRHPVEITGG